MAALVASPSSRDAHRASRPLPRRPAAVSPAPRPPASSPTSACASTARSRAPRASSPGASGRPSRFPTHEPPRHAPARRHPAHRRLRGRAPRRHRQAGRAGGAPGPGPLGRHPGQRAGRARHHAGRAAPRAGPASCTGSTATPPGSWSWPRPTWPTAGWARRSPPGGCGGPTRRWPGDTSTRARLVIEAPIARHPTDRKRMAVAADGRAARTDAFVVARFEVVRPAPRSSSTPAAPTRSGCTWSTSGHPVVGDPVYGGGGSRRISGPAPADGRAARAGHAAAGAARRRSGIPPSCDRSEPLEFRVRMAGRSAPGARCSGWRRTGCSPRPASLSSVLQ